MRAPEADFEVSRIYWLGPLTIVSSIAAVLMTRWAGLTLLTVPPRFDPLGAAPSIIDTFILVTIAIFVFAAVASAGHDRPRRRYRIIAFICLLVSFGPDVLILRRGFVGPAALLMAEHVAAWFVTVEMLTRLA